MLFPLAKSVSRAAIASAGVGLTLLAQRTILKYRPPKVWKFIPPSSTTTTSGFNAMNQPTAGARITKDLPKGQNLLQLHSMATPNGVKVTTLMEELVSKYGPKLEYDAYPINIMNGDQFTSGFVSINPNSKIPALVHYKEGLDKSPIRIFESASIMLYLCEQFDVDHLFLPSIEKDPARRAECLSWVFWCQGSAPFLGGGYGHFYAYAPVKIQYAIDRFAMEAKRQLDVLNRHLGAIRDDNTTPVSAFVGGPYICGDQFTIADLCIWAWYGSLFRGDLYTGSKEFLQLEEEYPHVQKWVELIGSRDAVRRGRIVNRMWGPEEEQLIERHGVEDFDVSKNGDKVK